MCQVVLLLGCRGHMQGPCSPAKAEAVALAPILHPTKDGAGRVTIDSDFSKPQGEV